MLRVTRSVLTAEQRRALECHKPNRFWRFVARVITFGPGCEAWVRLWDRELAEGVVEVAEVEAERLVMGTDASWEHPLVVCDVGEGLTLCLIGQWLFDPHTVVDDPGWSMPDNPGDPSECRFFRRFSLIRTPRTGTVLELRATAPEVMPAERFVRIRLRWRCMDAIICRDPFESVEQWLEQRHWAILAAAQRHRV